jgi:hypothetical protein
MRFFGVIKHRHNLGDIHAFGSLVEMIKGSIQIVYNHSTKGRLDRCFGDLLVGSIAGTEACSRRRTGRQ